MSNGGSYDPHAVEQKIYRFWEQGGHFHAQPDPNKQPYVIDIPLPNVTGALHLGHAMNNTLQDLLIRRHRMMGYEALWMPGTDHAGIATQAVVEKRLKEQEGITRHELGREKLVERIWAWKEEYGGRILGQLRRMGASCDWDRTRFTLDEVCAKAVYEVFFQWFKAGLIYRGLRLVNWDAYLQTAVADDEIIHETVKSHLWHYRYPLLEGSTGGSGRLSDAVVKAAIERATQPDAKMGVDYLSIATTRPETMLGDTAIAVAPDDERYRHLVGQYCLLPLVNRAIPIVADGLLVDKAFGTGCVKVTPGHDPNDYACALRNNLEMINILMPDGQIRTEDRFAPYGGVDRYAARDKVVADLEALGLMEKIEDYEHEVGHSDRSKTPIEPMLSEQWFVKMADLAETAMEAARDGRVQFFPQRYAKTYLDWLGEKRDWCISRQLWWGHRIPVWSREMKLSELVNPTSSETHGLSAIPYDECCTVVEEVGGEHRWVDLGRNNYDRWSELEALLHEGDRDIRISICIVKRSWPTLTIDELREQYDLGQREGIIDADVSFEDFIKPSTFDKYSMLVRTVENAGLTQDPDVLDTWFSSALWPFSTLGWPDNYGKEGSRDQGNKGSREASGSTSIPRSLDPSIPTTDLSYFYPTSVLVTARDIITLWVARMVITGLYFQKRVPFHHVYIHPNIQDIQGRRMNKTLGNGVDPLDIIQMYGADALRFTMAQMASETQDARLPVAYLCPHCGALTPQSSAVPHNKVPRDIHEVKCGSCKKPFATVWAPQAKKDELGVGIDTSDRFEQGRNLCNKLWQVATGFVLPNLQGSVEPRAISDLAVEDRWILSRLAATIADVDRRYASYQINEIVSTLYSFFWNDYCDWYVELIKPRLFERDASGTMTTRTDASAAVARQVLAWVLDQTLRLLHPVTPFITEELWQKLGETVPQRGISDIQPAAPALIRASWPDANAFARDLEVERELDALQGVIRALRDTLARINQSRSAAKEPAIGKLPQAVIRTDEQLAAGLQTQMPVLLRLGRTEALEIGAAVTKPPESATQVLTGVEVYVPLAGLMDLAAERKRLQKESEGLAAHLKRLTGKLANEEFVAKAPANVVEQERQRLAEMKDRLASLDRNLADLAE